MVCRVTGILDMDGKPLNIPTFHWVQELENRVSKLEKLLEEKK